MSVGIGREIERKSNRVPERVRCVRRRRDVTVLIVGCLKQIYEEDEMCRRIEEQFNDLSLDGNFLRSGHIRQCRTH